MVQIIGAILIFVLIKLLFDLIKPTLPKTSPPTKGDFIDISEKWINTDNLPYKKNDSLLSQRELGILRLFQEVLPLSRYAVYPHLRLADLLQVPAGSQNRQEHLFRIKERSLDLVILAVDQLQPVLVVNFTHRNDGKREQTADQFTENALRSAGYELMTVDPDNPPSREQIITELSGFGLLP